MHKILFFLFLGCCFFYQATGQSCDSLGQMPHTAFPVCGTSTFYQQNVPICKSSDLPVPGCRSSQSTVYANKNPFWYKFKCYQSCSLGFLITPISLADDYDWQLFDITGHDPLDVFQDASLVVAGNWSGTPGLTGASANGVNSIQCASAPKDNAPAFSTLPSLIQGHDYLLLVSHYSNNQSGYSLTFNEGAPYITDNSRPKMISVSTEQCTGKSITIQLNKRVKCSSLSTQGNVEFVLIPNGTIAGPIPNIVSVTGNDCTNGFDLNTITIHLDNVLPVGLYKIRIKNGADGNTLLDYCDNAILVNEEIGPFYSSKKINPDFNYTIKYGCKFDTVNCSVIDTAGIRQFNWILDGKLMNLYLNPNPQLIFVSFGNKEIALDVIDKNNCTVRAVKTINLFNSMEADFEATQIVCPNDSVVIENKSTGNGLVNWFWDFGSGKTINETRPTRHIQYYPENPYSSYKASVKLRITNTLGCTDSLVRHITIANNCYIDVPNAFTPNGDGANDYLYPLNGYKTTNLTFAVYNRYGQKVFHSEDWTKKWNGTLNGVDLEQGTYIWFLNYFDTEKRKWINRKGTTLLLR